MPSLQRGDATLWYDTHGSGRPIVLLHSLAGDGTMWAGIAGALTDYGRVIMLDARGHGKSPAIGEISVAQYARDAVALFQALDLIDAVVVGLSMGGQAAMMLAQALPGSISGLVLADTSLGQGTDGIERRRSVEERIAAVGWVTFTEEYVASRLSRSNSEAARRYANAMLTVSTEVYVEQSVSISMLELTHLASQIAAPTLVLVGQQDASTPPSAAAKLAATIPGATLEEIVDANHLSVLDQPLAFAQAVVRHLEMIGRQGGRG